MEDSSANVHRSKDDPDPDLPLLSEPVGSFVAFDFAPSSFCGGDEVDSAEVATNWFAARAADSSSVASMVKLYYNMYLFFFFHYCSRLC